MDVPKDYPAETLEQSIDLMIHTSKVVIFEKSWCLFSMDAKDFLLQQLGVSFVSIPIDETKDGDRIAHYIKTETGHKTFPAIFVKGDFLGGFEDVNAMYSTGQLEAEYFKRVTQADRCEMEARAIKSGKKPYFWFPEKVNAYSVRVTGVLTCFAALTACIGFSTTWGPLIAAGILLDFTLRIIAGPRLSLINKVACFLTKAWEPKLRLGRPKQFAACCGFLFAFLSTVCFCIPFPAHEYLGAVFILGLAIATGMEGFFDFCLGCVFFKVGMQLGIIPK
jgi:glutaredoxin 3